MSKMKDSQSFEQGASPCGTTKQEHDEIMIAIGIPVEDDDGQEHNEIMREILNY